MQILTPLSKSIALWLSAGSVAAGNMDALWIGRGMSDWANPTNWAGGIVPTNTAADKFYVTIPLPEGYDYQQINAPDNVEINGLTQFGSVINQSGTSNFRIQENFRWVGGTFQGGTLTLNGNSRFEGPGYKYLGGVILVMNGLSRWVDGFLDWELYGRVEIMPDATFQIEADGILGTEANTSSADVFNRGTIRVLAPGKTPLVAGALTNEGLIDIQSGTLRALWTYGGTGAVNVASGGKFIISGPGTWQGPQITNAGEIIFDSREQNFTSDTLFPGAVRIAAPMGGTGNLILAQADWEAGEMSGEGLTIVPIDGRLQVKGRVTLNRSLQNNGVLSLGPSVFLDGYHGLWHTNRASGVVRLRSGSRIGDPSVVGAYFVNEGTVLKEDDTGSSGVYMRFHNDGLTRVSNGELFVAGGSDSFIPHATSSGAFSVAAGARIRIDDMNFSPTARLEGDGEIRLTGGEFGGAVGTNLSLTLTSVGMVSSAPIDVRILTLAGQCVFPASYLLNAREKLMLGGIVGTAQLRSENVTEVGPGDFQMQQGATLDSRGITLWDSGVWSASDSSVIRTTGDVLLLGDNNLTLKSGSVLSNQATWTAMQDVESFAINITPQFARLTTRAAVIREFPEPGPFQISGMVNISTGRLDALPGSRLHVSEFTSTNSLIQISQSRFTLSHALHTWDTTVALASSTIDAPAGGWTGSATLRGSGAINGAVRLAALRMEAAPTTNVVVIDGDLELGAANVSLAYIFPAGTNLLAPRLQVNGTVTLRGSLGFSGVGQTDGPVINVLIDSLQRIAGAFENVANGEILPTPDVWRFRIFYGDGSPYGSNRVVAVRIGTPFDEWRSTRFKEAELQDMQISGTAADPDGNGLSNMAEFVLGAPREPVAIGTLVSIEQTTDGYTLIHAKKRREVGNVRARIGLSETLQDWSEVVLGESSTELPLQRAFDLGTLDEFIYRYPKSPPRLFLRIIVEAL